MINQIGENIFRLLYCSSQIFWLRRKWGKFDIVFIISYFLWKVGREKWNWRTSNLIGSRPSKHENPHCHQWPKLTFFHTMQTSISPWKEVFWKHSGKRICLFVWGFYAISIEFQLFNSDKSQIHGFWTILNRYLTSPLSWHWRASHSANSIILSAERESHYYRF